MRHLGLEKRDLIKASLTMTSASGNRLPIIGAALTRIKLTQADRETRQMVYFSPIATKLYLSLSTCSDLGLIGSSFPTTSTLQDRQVVEVTKTMLPFRDLLRPTTPFRWTDELSKAMDASKLHICSKIQSGVEIFDKGRPTCLATDWSKSGIGFWLTQKHCKCQTSDPFCCRDGWRVTLVGSRFTHAAESRYAPVEGEALAVADALDKTRHFVLGCSDLVIVVDHKPLLKLFGDRCLEDIPNPRLRNLKERTLRYRFRMTYIPGVHNQTSDALSRHPSGSESPTRLHLQDDVILPSLSCSTNTPQEEDDLPEAECSAISVIPINWEGLQISTTEDPNMQDLMQVIEEGPPSTKDMLPLGIQPYWRIMADLSINNDVVCYGDRIVVPLALRQPCLLALHSAHQGVSGMMARANSSLYWPGMTRDIEATRTNCTELVRKDATSRARSDGSTIRINLRRLLPPRRVMLPGRGG